MASLTEQDKAMRERVECYGLEYNPDDQETCQSCALKDRCKVVFAEVTLIEVATLLGKTLEVATDEEIAEHLGTIPKAVAEARLHVSSVPEAPLKARKLRAVPDPSPAAGEDGTVATAPKSPKRRGRPKKDETPEVPLEAPSEAQAPLPVPSPNGTGPQPMQVTDGFGWNLSTGEVRKLRWAGFPPLITLPGLAPIFTVEFWFQPLEKWVWLVARRTKRNVPPIAIELTVEDAIRAGYFQHLGKDPKAAWREHLGARILEPQPTAQAPR